MQVEHRMHPILLCGADITSPVANSVVTSPCGSFSYPKIIPCGHLPWGQPSTDSFVLLITPLPMVTPLPIVTPPPWSPPS